MIFFAQPRQGMNEIISVAHPRQNKILDRKKRECLDSLTLKQCCEVLVFPSVFGDKVATVIIWLGEGTSVQGAQTVPGIFWYQEMTPKLRLTHPGKSGGAISLPPVRSICSTAAPRAEDLPSARRNPRCYRSSSQPSPPPYQTPPWFVWHCWVLLWQVGEQSWYFYLFRPI